MSAVVTSVNSPGRVMDERGSRRWYGMNRSVLGAAVGSVCVAALALAGCSSSADVAGDAAAAVAPGDAVHSMNAQPPSGNAPAVACSQPAGTGSICFTGQNNAQTFRSPGVLGPGTLGLVATTCGADLYGGSNNLQCVGNGSTLSNDGPALRGQLMQYQAPRQMPQSDTVTVTAANQPSGNDSSNAGCNNSQFMVCTVTGVQQTDPVLASFTITNLPVTVQVINNLGSGKGDTLTMQGQPQAYQMVIDPVGGNPVAIKPSSTGYFGLYGSTGVVNSDPESFYVQYKIGAESTDLAGSRFLINVVIDPKTGQLDTSAGAGCTFAPGTSAQSGTTYCDLSLEGAVGGPQTVIVDIHQ